ncbi:TIGR03084 family protein [Frankineae bacterium MT45]|nr:TIGR03084 family protein [Frankineae bacterium MT45]
MSDLSSVVGDLVREGDDLDALVDGADDWSRPTAAAGWTIAHQIAHLAWTDQKSLLAATDPEGFARDLQSAIEHAATYVDDGADAGAELPRAELLAQWRSGRRALAEQLLSRDPALKLPWYGPPMSPTTMATARIMETWAHGQDVADALGVTRTPTARLRNIAHLGVRTRDFAYLVNDRTPPSTPFRVDLIAPNGELWSWGPADSPDRISAPALDFCLLVTQRRHRDDLSIVATGEALAWLPIAQAFAGQPGAGRPPATQASTTAAGQS